MISCPLEGNPPASYQWYLNPTSSNELILIKDRQNNTRLLNNNRTLYVETFEEMHNGRYICSAKNILGHSNYSAFPSVDVNSK